MCVFATLHNVGCWCVVSVSVQTVCVHNIRTYVQVYSTCSHGAILQLKALLCSSNFCPMNAVFVYTMLHKVE